MINPIKRLRKEKGLSQRDLALLLNISAGYVGQWEAEVTLPSKKTLSEIASLFQVETKELIREFEKCREIKRKELRRKLGLKA